MVFRAFPPQMPDESPEFAISGNCIYRSLRHILSVDDALDFHISPHIQRDAFYTKIDRMSRYDMIFDECFDEENDEKMDFSPEEIEDAVRREVRERDPTPPPRKIRNEKLVSFRLNGASKPCFHRETPLCGPVPGIVFLKFFKCYLAPGKYHELVKKKFIRAERMYTPEEQLQLFVNISEKRLIPLPSASINHTFHHFLEIQDVKAILGNEFAVMDEHRWASHLHMLCSKLDRIRTEIVTIQVDKTTPAYVVKFLDLLLERVILDHRNYEIAHFDNRKMAIKDRMEQLPTSTKSKRKEPASKRMIKFDAKKRYVLDDDVIRTAHPYLFSWLQTKTGVEFQEMFLEYTTNSFVDVSNAQPSKGALIFAEKFFRWAAETLEFEKLLTPAARATYGFMERPYHEASHIPLRVNYFTEDHQHITFVFLEDVRHALRRYDEVTDDLDFELRPPNLPGPIPQIHEWIELYDIEQEIYGITDNQVYCEIESVCDNEPTAFKPYPGPFNRHVLIAETVLNRFVDVFMQDLNVGVEMDPSHREAQTLVDKITATLPVSKFRYFIDLDLGQQLLDEAFALRKHKVSRIDERTLHEFAARKLQVVDRLKGSRYENQRRLFLNRSLFVYAFPQAAELIHHYFCDDAFCYKSILDEFRPWFGPCAEEFADSRWRPELVCNSSAERHFPISGLEKIF